MSWFRRWSWGWVKLPIIINYILYIIYYILYIIYIIYYILLLLLLIITDYYYYRMTGEIAIHSSAAISYDLG
jgi:hypothetical protein